MNIFYIAFSILLFTSCSDKESKIDYSQYIGEYELKSCFTEYNFYSNAEGGCEIYHNEDKVILEMVVQKNKDEGCTFLGYFDDSKLKYESGDNFGEVIIGKTSFWIYQNDGTTYEFGRIYNITGGNTSSGRCIAITQKGTRCKRKASKGSSYCWQHKYNH